MSAKVDKIISLIKPFGLDNSAASVFLYLLQQSEASALDISRASRISRTKVYTILDRLAELGLVTVSGRKTARRFKANSYKQLEALVNQKRTQVDMLESSLPILFNELSSLELAVSQKSQIMHYQGLEGLKTVTWNSTQAVGTLRVFELSQDMGAFLDFGFSERVRIEFVKRGLLKQSLQLTNFSKISPWTNIEEFVDLWECRYIDPKQLSFSTEILVYNDVVTMYQFQHEEIFCVEIHNRDLAEMQKSVFDFIWQRAANMQKYGIRGSAKLVR